MDRIVDSMVKWMSTHSNGLSTLAEKVDKFEALLQKAELKHSRPETRSQPQDLCRENEKADPFSRSSDTTRQSAWPPVAQWPKMLQLLSTSGVCFEKQYITNVEDRPTLRLRPCSFETDGMKNEVNHSGGECKDFQHLPPALQSNDTINIDLSGDIIRPIFDSFLDHVDTFYSFLDRQHMRVAFQQFAERHGQPCTKCDYSVCAGKLNEERPAKRRRTESPQVKGAPRSMARSPSTAMILLALSIGEVTMQKEPLSSTSDPLAPFTYSSEHESLRLIPGIEYFAAATNIIGDYMDGHELINAQVFLLAGIYKAQLARTKEASTWYSMAGRVLSHLVSRRQLFDEHETEVSTQEPSRKSFHSIQPYRSSQDDLILRAAWACLHLEDDLLPELGLPQSGLGRLRNRMLLPIPTATGSQIKQAKWPGAEVEEQRRLIYTAQLQLRRKFDHIQALLQLDSSYLTHDQVTKSFKHHAAALQRWRSQLPPQLQWKDKDGPSNDLLHAQLRHLYWKAKTAILLPFLYQALHADEVLKEKDKRNSNIGLEKNANSKEHILAAVDTLLCTSGKQEILRLAELCIEAIKQSLSAYAGVCGRLIVSNVQTVAHGQFENVMLLVAASRSETLSEFIATDNIQRLLENVVSFLKQLSPISPTAAADCGILQGVGTALGLIR